MNRKIKNLRDVLNPVVVERWDNMRQPDQEAIAETAAYFKSSIPVDYENIKTKHLEDGDIWVAYHRGLGVSVIGKTDRKSVV